jgi:diadenosine tetraphosphate (Ap4A) HIT family hydrolase
VTIIYTSENFVVEAPEKPLIDRNDGGHIKISPKIKIVDRQQLEPKLAIEFIRLTIVVGKAMAEVLTKKGIDIGRINYHDDGNWSVFKLGGPYFHYHLFGRAKGAKYQPYGQAVNHPLRESNPDFYKDYKPLSDEDVKEIKEKIIELFKQKEYSDKEWKLNN